MNIERLALLPTILLLAGCADSVQTGLMSTGPAFGDAVQQTLAAQVVNPEPRYNFPDPAGSGQQTSLAIDRFNAGQVKQPERVTTRTSAGGSAGAGAGGGT